MKKKLGIISILVVIGVFGAFLIAQVSGLRCYKCSGKGSIEVKVDCPVCNGRGTDKWGDKCYRCDGRGYIWESQRCPECNGSGQQTKPVSFPEPERRY